MGVIRMKRISRKGNMNLMTTSILSFVVAIIIAVVGLNILVNLQASQTADSAAYNATTTGISSISDLLTWFPIIAIVIAAVVVLGYVAFLKITG